MAATAEKKNDSKGVYWAGVTHRRPGQPKHADNGALPGRDEDKSKRKRDRGRLWPWPSVIVLFFFCVGLTHYFGNLQPMPRLAVDTPLDEVSEERALHHVTYLAGLGPHMTGTYQNEVLATNYILDFMRNVQRTAPLKGITMEIDVQHPSGCFNMFFVGFNYTNCFQNVTNIVVRLSASDPAQGTTNNALLVNAHYDSAASSPGASDDGASIGIMMEIVRALAHGKPLKHAVVFLFNGAEESYLQASHGFITQHKWAKTLSAFINMESTGAGGRELVFQTGPGHSWLINAYATAAPRPHATIVAEEIFQSGAIPGDTDFRVFRDYGQLPGLDLAYYANGYVYHTPLDDISFIEPGALQRCAENVMQTILAIVESKALTEPFAYGMDKTVFYDILGLWAVVYNMSTATVVNTAVGGVAALYLLLSGGIRLASLKAVVALVGGWVMCFATGIGLGAVLNAFGMSMVWYGHPWLLPGMFAAPTALVLGGAVRLLDRQSRPEAAEKSSFDAHVIVGLVFMVTMTWMGLGSAYVAMHWLLWPIIARVTIGRLLRSGPVVPVAIGSVVPLLLGSQLLHLLFMVFVPILGRSGSTVQTDSVAGAMVAFAVASTTTTSVGFVHLDGYWSTVTIPMVLGITLLSWGYAAMSFPYTPSRPHRIFVQHTVREFQPTPGSAGQGALDHGFMVVPCDSQGTRYAEQYLGNVVAPLPFGPEADQLAHMLPWYLPLERVFSNQMYVEGPRPTLPSPLANNSSPLVGPGEEMIQTEQGPWVVHSSKMKPCQHDGRLTCRRISVRAYSPSQMTLLIAKGRNYVPGREDTTVVKAWSMGAVYSDKHKPFHFVFMAAGIDPTIWRWWVEVEDGNVLHFTLNGHYFATKGYAPAVDTIRNVLPEWISVVSLSSHLANYTL